jgi:hypothetical protein
MEQFEVFGQFGNANYYRDQDWKDVGRDQFYLDNFGTKIWDATTQTCTLHANLHYTVTYAETGFT